MHKVGREKIAVTIGAASVALCVSAGMALAAKPGGAPGGHPAAAPAPHAAAPHFTPHVAAPHFTPHVATPHFTPHMAVRPHFTPHAAGHPHFTPHISATHNQFSPRFTSHGVRGRHLATPSVHAPTASRFGHGLNQRGLNEHALNRRALRHGRNAATLAHPLTTTSHPLANAAHVRPLAHAADPRRFEERRRHFADNAAFRPFWRHDWRRHGWHPYYHLGWIGPLFWPYAYGDFFYYALWPYDYEYVDPFWAYGYGDIYEAIFSPYSYEEYVSGPRAPERMATLTQGMAQSCDEEAGEVTGWPIDQIQSAVQPDPQQTHLLDDLGNAIVEASHQIKIQCPTSVAFTPTARLDQMRQRLQALVDAVNLISPPLTKFYDSLSDEQKARFNDIAPPAPKTAAAGNEDRPTVQAQCNANVMAWPTDRIDNALRPNDAQRVKLDALQSALSHAADTIKAACPTEAPATPPDRLAAVGNRLKAMLRGVETVQPELADFYNSLSDGQKARFNTMGRQLFAQNQ